MALLYIRVLSITLVVCQNREQVNVLLPERPNLIASFKTSLHVMRAALGTLNLATTYVATTLHELPLLLAASPEGRTSPGHTSKLRGHFFLATFLAE